LHPFQTSPSPASQLEPSLRREILVEQVGARVTVARSMVPFGIAAACTFTWYFCRHAATGDNPIITSFCLLAACYAAYSLVVVRWTVTSRDPAQRAILYRLVPVFYVAMGSVGTAWAWLIYLTSRAAPADSFSMIFATIIGLISLTTFNSPVRFAIWTWVPLMASGYAVIATIHVDYKLPLLIFLTIYAVAGLMSCFSMDRKVFAQALAGIENRQQAQTISMLLNEFAEANSNALWAIGPDMKFRTVSESLRRMFAPLETALLLEGLSIPALARRFITNAPGTVAGDVLVAKMQAGEVLRDILVSVAAGDGLRYWSITGRPVTDAFGAFAGYEGYLSDQTDTVLVKQELEFRANFDSVTKLYNRHQFERLLREWVENGWQRKFALLLLDLDGFKEVNDTYGHLAGDDVLEMVAARLRHCVREHDLVARTGGDEFAVLLGTNDRAAVLELGARVIRALEQIFVVDAKPILIGASIGAALWPEHGINDVLLYQNADIALYQAKSRGGACIEVYGAYLNAEGEIK
jgi:diguanylate cyclase (GGDEF)-like protein